MNFQEYTVPIGSIKRRFDRDGYVIIPRVFSTQECSLFAEEINRVAGLEANIADIFRIRDLSAFQRAGVSKAEAGEQYFIIGSLPDHGRLLASLVSDRRITTIASAVLGGRGRSVPIRYHFSNITNKPARIGPRISWHRDFPNTLITLDSAQFCRIMVCLDGMTRSNGPTAFEPGTHRISDSSARRCKGHRQARNPRRERLALCPPGSVVVIHPKVRHGGGVNRSLLPRRNVIVQWGIGFAKLVASSLEAWSGTTPDALQRGVPRPP